MPKTKKIECPNCEELISRSSKYCRHCGTRIKRKKKKNQEDLAGQGKKIDKLQARIKYLEDELDDAGIRYNEDDDDEDDDDDGE